MYMGIPHFVRPSGRAKAR
ncbi:hypothetical protein [Pseudomonas sp. Z8(2022)]